MQQEKEKEKENYQKRLNTQKISRKELDLEKEKKILNQEDNYNEEIDKDITHFSKIKGK